MTASKRAFVYLADSMVLSQASAIIAAFRAVNLPTMFADVQSVQMGGLAGYGPDFLDAGRRCARYVRAILLGASRPTK